MFSHVVYNMRRKTEVPDGGWGWMVVFGVALTNMVNQSLLSLFGLVFGEELEAMGHGTVGVALVMNINSMVTNFSGLITGPILKRYSSRTVTFIGVIMTGFGMIISSMATNIVQIIIGYSCFSGLGMGLIMPATFVAVNSYFRVKRSQAVGLAMAGTSAGQMLMPQVVRFLLDEYGYRGTTLILGGLCFNGLVGALLFQPVEWHIKEVEEDGIMESTTLLSKQTKISIIPEKDENKTVEEVKILQQKDENKNAKKSMLKRLVLILDLELLTDFVFVHITLGLALVYTCGVAFSMLFPFFLQEGILLSRSDTALCMSLLSGCDILSRLTIPLITRRLKIGCRMTFLVGAALLAFARSFLAEQETFEWVIAGSIFCGYIRAMSVVNQNLTISEYCPDSKLPAAIGLNMVTKGLIVLSVGQFLGWVRDYTQSFSMCIHVQNLIILAVVASWSAEIVLKRRKKTNAENS